MSWNLTKSKSDSSQYSASIGEFPPEWISYTHESEEEHTVFVKEIDGEFFGVAYIGSVNPHHLKHNNHCKWFDTWVDAKNWAERTTNFYEKGLDESAPDVLDLR